MAVTWYPIERPMKVFTPLSKSAPAAHFERIERYAYYSDVVVLWALGCDAAILFGQEADVLDTIRFASEDTPFLFHPDPIEA